MKLLTLFLIICTLTACTQTSEKMTEKETLDDSLKSIDAIVDQTEDSNIATEDLTVDEGALGEDGSDAKLKDEINDIMSTASYVPYSPELFDAARAKSRLIVLDFHATWCPSCQAQHPEMIAAFIDYEADATGLQVDYDSAQELRQKYQVSRQNTKIFFDKNGNEVYRTLDHMSATQIQAKFAEIAN